MIRSEGQACGRNAASTPALNKPFLEFYLYSKAERTRGKHLAYLEKSVMRESLTTLLLLPSGHFVHSVFMSSIYRFLL